MIHLIIIFFNDLIIAYPSHHVISFHFYIHLLFELILFLILTLTFHSLYLILTIQINLFFVCLLCFYYVFIFFCLCLLNLRNCFLVDLFFLFLLEHSSLTFRIYMQIFIMVNFFFTKPSDQLLFAKRKVIVNQLYYEYVTF